LGPGGCGRACRAARRRLETAAGALLAQKAAAPVVRAALRCGVVLRDALRKGRCRRASNNQLRTGTDKGNLTV
jgi:hypothetical protein